MDLLENVEIKRLDAQARLDGAKAQAERNKLGQFATPAPLASEILEYARKLSPKGAAVRFLDPAFGTGSFYSAFLRSFPSSMVASAAAYEVDALYGEAASALWGGTPLRLEVADFTTAIPPKGEDEKANLLICNPPYVRHHHLGKEEKERLGRAAERASGVRPGGLSGLYCHFMLISHAWMARGALAAWIVPSEFMDVGYGGKVKEYLLDRATLTRIHRFDPVEAQFKDALVSSAVVWLENHPPPPSHSVEFTYGGTLLAPEASEHIRADALRAAAKWTKFPRSSGARDAGASITKLSNLFEVKRGIATGANDFFVLAPEDVRRHRLPEEFLRPILPSPRYLSVDEVEGDEEGGPILERRRFLLSCALPEGEVRRSHPSLWRYLQKGVAEGIDSRYLCGHRRPWYSQENRPPAPLLCTYMNRRVGGVGRIFRFVLNKSEATAPNVYLMLYPRGALRGVFDEQPELLRKVWVALNGLTPEMVSAEGRVYGGGLYKIEPKELGNISADTILDAVPELRERLPAQESPTLFTP